MNTHKRLSIQFLRSYAPDVLAITVPNKTKAPIRRTDFSGPDALVKSSAALKDLEENENSLQPGAVFRGRWIDVDLDEVNPTLEEALATFINTPFIFGRKSKPRSHFLVRLNEPIEDSDPRFRFMKTIRSLGLNMELRGHKHNFSNHTNLPGGQHETGESVTWFDPDNMKKAMSVTPPEMDLFDFARSLRKAVVAAKLVEYWTEGARHELSLGLAGMLSKNYKIMVDNEDIPDGVRIVFDEGDCESLIRFIARLAGDEEVEDRVRASKNTWKKTDLEKISGYDKLCNIMGEEAARVLRVSIAGSPFMDTVEKYNQQVAYHPQMMAFVILDEIPKWGITFRTPTEYMTHQPSHLIPMPGKKETFVHAAKALRFLQVTRNIDETDFLPTQEALVYKNGKTVLNNFRGWRVQPYPDAITSEDEDIWFVKNHILNIISSGNKDLAHWITSFFADIYKEPNIKPGTALILVGKQGVGKSSLAGILGGALGVSLGARLFDSKSYYMSTGDIDRIMSRFNDHMEGTLLVQLEEVIQSSTSRSMSAIATASRLKDLITRSQDIIEAKGQKVRFVPNYSRYILTSNSIVNSSRIEEHDRRYTIVEVADTVMDDLEYWQKFYKLAGDEKFHSKVFKWLLEYKYDKATIQRPYDTEVKKRTRDATAMREESEAELNFMVHLCQRENMPFDHKLIEAHWEATMDGAMEAFNKIWSQGIWTESWPKYVSTELWEKAYLAYLRESMKMSVALPPQDIHFLGRRFILPPKARKNVQWTTRPPVEQRKRERRNLIVLPTRKRMYEEILKVRKLNDEIRATIEENIEQDESYRFVDKNSDDAIDQPY